MSLAHSSTRASTSRPRPVSKSCCVRPSRSICAAASTQRGRHVEVVQCHPALLAAMYALSMGLISVPMVVPPAALADTEDYSGLSPAERRARERRDLLRATREKAEAASSGVTAQEQADAVSAADAAAEDNNARRQAETARSAQSFSKLSVESYEKEAARAFKAPPVNILEGSPLDFSLPPPPEKLSDIKLPDVETLKGAADSLKGRFESLTAGDAEPSPGPSAEAASSDSSSKGGFFSLFSSPAPAPAPTVPAAPAAPAPVPSPAPVPPVAVQAAPVPVPPPPPPAPVAKAEPVKPAPAPVASKPAPPTPAQVSKAEVKEASKTAAPGSTKRKGPLPQFLAQLIVLGMLAGVGAAATKYGEQSSKALAVVGGAVVAGYKKAEAVLNKQ